MKTDRESTVGKAKDREESLNLDEAYKRLINRHTTQSGMLFGQLILFESGKIQPLLTLDETSDHYQINSVTSESLNSSGAKKGGKSPQERKQEFIDSILYFGVRDNHVLVLPSIALKPRDLETHINWLLTSKTDILKGDSIVYLEDKPDEQTIKRLEKQPVRRIEFGSEILTKSKLVEIEDGKKAVMSTGDGLGANIISSLLTYWNSKEELVDCLDDANLKVKMAIYPTKKTDAKGQKLLDSLSLSLRNVEADDLLLKLHGGGVIEGKDLKLQGTISAKTNNGLIDENDLFHTMREWFENRVRGNELELHH